LTENLGAIPLFFYHALNTARLPFDALQAAQQITFDFGVSHRASDFIERKRSGVPHP
jgi:hypothetical protein